MTKKTIGLLTAMVCLFHVGCTQKQVSVDSVTPYKPYTINMSQLFEDTEETPDFFPQQNFMCNIILIRKWRAKKRQSQNDYILWQLR